MLQASEYKRLKLNDSPVHGVPDQFIHTVSNVYGWSSVLTQLILKEVLLTEHHWQASFDKLR